MKMRKLKKYKPTKFKAKDSVYDKDAADFAVSFIECLCHTKGTWAGKPFELIDWQEQIIRDVFGTMKPNGYRQFNTAYIEIPKKQGKSELAAAVALLLCCGDGEERAEVYGCAADRQQASIVFEVAADMVRMCPALNKRVKILASQKRIIFQPTNSFYQVLSAEAYSKHGFNIHGVVFDELHTQPNRKLFDVMTKGSGDARMQPLYFLITTAGTDTNSICYETHQKAKDILEGRKIDPTFYPVIYGADESDDWTDPKVWKKANPSLDITVGIDKVKAACESAKQNPGEENSFRQLRLNQWVKQAVRWMPMEKWDAGTMSPMMCGSGRASCRPRRGMWCIMDILRSSLSAWGNGSTSGRLLLTGGAPCRWSRTWKAWDSRWFLLARDLRTCRRLPRS